MQIICYEPPPDYAVIDAETTELEEGEIPQTEFWGYADKKGYERFETTKSLIKFLRKVERKVLLHHTAFDIIQLMVDGFYDIEILRSNKSRGKLIQCRLMQKHMTQNTFSVFPESMAKLFKPFGYEKSSLKQLAKRNYEDCVNGLDTFLRLDSLFFDLVGVHPLGVGTVAGTTFKAAESVAGKMPCNLHFIDAYRGGRVEVFSVNRQMASLFDINSSYPRSFLEAKEKEELWHVRVKTSDWIGPLFWADVQDMLLFPNGEFESWVFKSNWERYIEPYADKTKIKILSRHSIDTSWLTRCADLVLDIFNKKAANTGNALAVVCKFLLNAFYGRIGLKPESERVRILDYEPFNVNEAWKLGKGKWIAFDTVERKVRSNYPFAAFITDNARARLYESFKRNRPLYGDTDSIFTTNKNFVGETGKSCGSFCYKKRSVFRARNVKDYEFDGEETVKGGIPGKPFTVWTMNRFARGKPVALMTRKRETELRKRHVNKDGTTSPHVVSKQNMKQLKELWHIEH